jgi:hypothetical protein
MGHSIKSAKLDIMFKGDSLYCRYIPDHELLIKIVNKISAYFLIFSALSLL